MADFWIAVTGFASVGLLLGGAAAWLLRNEGRISALEQWKTDVEKIFTRYGIRKGES